jgi:4-hydroxybenzoate polyprenyltransferase
MFEVVLFPILQTFGFETVFESGSMTLLILATVLIAAGGNVLNDYFDVKIDLINRPDKVIVGNLIPRQATMIYYEILTGLGILCGLYLAFIASSFTLCFIFIIVPGLLWFYSASYKRQFLTGNLIVAFMAALSILVVGITQLAFLEKVYGNLIFETPIPSLFYGWIGGFALFAFLCTWIREIIKDIEDEIGDREMECRTLPIKWGIPKTKLFLYALIILTVAGLFIFNELFIHFEGSLTIRYIIFGLAIPFIVLIYMIFAAKTVADFHQASTLSKVIMLIGVLYSFVFYFLQAKMYGISIFNLFILK